MLHSPSMTNWICWQWTPPIDSTADRPHQITSEVDNGERRLSSFADDAMRMAVLIWRWWPCMGSSWPPSHSEIQIWSCPSLYISVFHIGSMRNWRSSSHRDLDNVKKNCGRLRKFFFIFQNQTYLAANLQDSDKKNVTVLPTSFSCI